MSSILLNRLEKRLMDEIVSIKESIATAPVAAPAAPVVAAAPPPALLKEIDTMRASISKTAAVASDASGEIASLKNVNAQLAVKIDALSAQLEKALVDLESKMTVLACKCAAQPAQPAQPAPRPVPVIMTAPAPAAPAPAPAPAQ